MRLIHQQCPKCKEQGRDMHQDNLCIWPDGHQHCFACGYHKFPYNNLEAMKFKLYKQKSGNPDKEIDFTEDLVYHLPQQCLEWLRKYNVTTQDIVRHNIAYYPKKHLLIFPIYDGEYIKAYSGRYFGDNKDYPKYITWNARPGLWKLFPKKESSTFVLTEDFVSALRVGHSFNAVPLLGTNCPNELFIQLLPQNPTLVVWLDSDKAYEGMKIAQRASQFIPIARTCITKQDPKCYTDNEIQTIINELIPNDSPILSNQIHV